MPDQEVVHEPGKDLSESQKWAILAEYLLNFDPVQRKLIHNAGVAIQDKFQIGRSTLHRIAKTYFDQVNADVLYPNFKEKKKGNVGPSSGLTVELSDCILEFNAYEGFRFAIRSFTQQFNGIYETDIKVTTMDRYVKLLHGVMKRSYIKPLLKDYHLVSRLQFILNLVEPVPGAVGHLQFRDLSNVFHIDEKWFFTRQSNQC